MKNKRRRVLLYSGIGVAISIIIIIATIIFSRNESIVLKMAIFPMGTNNSTYYFVLYDNILTVSFGERKYGAISFDGAINEDIRSNRFMRSNRFFPSRQTLRTYAIELTDLEMQNLLDLANKLEASGFNKPKILAEGAWYVSLLYNDKVYEINYWLNCYFGCLESYYIGFGCDDFNCKNKAEIFISLIDEIARLSPIPVKTAGIIIPPYHE